MTKHLLGANLRRLREERHWTQPELAEKTGLSNKMIQKLEHGRTNPSFETLDRLISALKIRAADLFTEPEVESTSAQAERRVGDMTISEMESLVARASSVDLETLKKENVELMSYLPSEFSNARPLLFDWQIGLARFFLTGNEIYLKTVREDVRQKILQMLRAHKLYPYAKARQKRT